MLILSIFIAIWFSCSLTLYLALSGEIDIQTVLMGPFGFMILYLQDKKEKRTLYNAKYKVGDKVKIKVYLSSAKAKLRQSDCEIVQVSIKSVLLNKNMKVVYKVRGSYDLDAPIFLYTLTQEILEEHILSDRKSRINKLY